MNKPLDDRRRRRLFLAAAAVVGLAALALSLLHRERPQPKAPALNFAPATVQVPPRPRPKPRSRPRGLSHAADSRRIAAVTRAAAPVARRFAVAFVAYGDGHIGASVRRAIRVTSTPRFARRLLGARPRLRREPAPGRVVAVQVSEDRSPAGLPVLVTVRRGGRTTQFPLLLERKDARWLVADLAG